MIKSRCTGNSFTRISKILFEYCSVVNRLHFIIKKSLAPSAPDIWKITKNLVPEQTRHPVCWKAMQDNLIWKFTCRNSFATAGKFWWRNNHLSLFLSLHFFNGHLDALGYPDFTAFSKCKRQVTLIKNAIRGTSGNFNVDAGTILKL